MDFAIDGKESGIGESELSFKGKQTVKITAKIAAYLPLEQDSISKKMTATPVTMMPYWDIERARIGETQKIKVELIVNGEAVEAVEIPANGAINDIKFSWSVQKSSWIAMRIYPSSHSNPIFIYIDKKPVLEKKSAEWCLAALNQCWKMKEPNIRVQEKKDAETVYEAARSIYQKMISEN